MALQNFEKQGWESFTISGSFTDLAITGEIVVLTGSSVECVDKDGEDVLSTILYNETLSVDGATLKVKLKAAGTEVASPYKITFKIKTSEDNFYEVDCEMYVKEY